MLGLSPQGGVGESSGSSGRPCISQSNTRTTVASAFESLEPPVLTPVSTSMCPFIPEYAGLYLEWSWRSSTSLHPICYDGRHGMCLASTEARQPAKHEKSRRGHVRDHQGLTGTNHVCWPATRKADHPQDLLMSPDRWHPRWLLGSLCPFCTLTTQLPRRINWRMPSLSAYQTSVRQRQRVGDLL